MYCLMSELNFTMNKAPVLVHQLRHIIINFLPVAFTSLKKGTYKALELYDLGKWKALALTCSNPF